MPWFVKIETGLLPKVEFDRYVPAHKEYVRALIDSGHHAVTGYWGERGGGMMLFQAESLEIAKEIVECDPLVKNGCVEYTLHEWCIAIGQVGC
jgi:uncharacterized protein YciI